MRMRIYQLARRWVPEIPLGISYRLAELAGDLIWLVNGEARQNIEHNQQRALGANATPREVALSSRQVLRNLAKIYIDEFRLPSLTEEELRQSVTIHGMEHLEASLAQGKGVILTSAHYGAPQVVGQLLAVLGYPTTVVVEHVQPEEVFEFMCEMRQSHGLRLLPIDKPLIGLIRTLRKARNTVVTMQG